MSEQENNAHVVQLDEQHSVEVSINKDGKWSGCVKCYGFTPDIAMKRTMDLAVLLEIQIEQHNNGVRK